MIKSSKWMQILQWVIAVIGTPVLILWTRSPDPFINARFFGEEGFLYFGSLQHAGLPEALTFVGNGNYQFLTNISAWLSTLVPLEHAPFVTTYFAIGVMAVTSLTLAHFAQTNGASRLMTLVFLAAWAMMVQGNEVFLNSTNLQWVCGVSMAAIAGMNVAGLGNRTYAALLVWVTCCGLTGVPSSIFAAAFWLVWLFERTTRRFTLASILSACAIFQLIVILNHDFPNRNSAHTIFTIFLPIALQVSLDPIIGFRWVHQLVKLLRGDVWYISLLIQLAGLAIIAVPMYALWRQTEKKTVAITIGLSLFYVSILQIMGSVGDGQGLISTYAGGRYLFAGATCLLMLIIAAAAKAPAFRLLLVYILVANTVNAAIVASNRASSNTSPRWADAVAQCADMRPCVIRVTPNREIFSVTLQPEPKKQ